MIWAGEGWAICVSSAEKFEAQKKREKLDTRGRGVDQGASGEVCLQRRHVVAQTWNTARRRVGWLEFIDITIRLAGLVSFPGRLYMLSLQYEVLKSL